ncbi:MAG: alpha/beta fold hydrolase [Gammaproteobacteria bacterium]|nr:alpha/beta fold hydrolase [Gammaproteobacteria bacterium]
MTKRILILSLLLLPTLVSAKTLLFIQGFNESGHVWRGSGIASSLLNNGWGDGGHILHGELPAWSSPSVGGGRDNTFYTLALPTEAPIMVQLAPLVMAVEKIKRDHPKESLTLVGHSVGGVLARMLLVQRPDLSVDTLISIATPHLGTRMAELGELVGDTPVSWMLPLMGAEEVNHANILFSELAREHPGSLLFWLNRQLHPAIRYISVVHTEDDVVIPPSQDMNRVVALAGKSEVVPLRGEHSLHFGDGLLLVDILQRK